VLAISSNRTYGESLPRSPRALGDALKRQSPVLASYGILINVSQKKQRINSTQGHIVEIRKSGNIGNIENKVFPPENKKSENVERF
jgi:hypothetical protein